MVITSFFRFKGFTYAVTNARIGSTVDASAFSNQKPIISTNMFVRIVSGTPPSISPT